MSDRVPGHVFQAERIEKPWGHELVWARTDRYAGKILFVRAGESLSLQYHRVKDETLSVLSGRVRLSVGASAETMTDVELVEGDCLRLPPGTRHRLEAIVDAHLLEASSPELDDVVRLEDRYGRAGA